MKDSIFNPNTTFGQVHIAYLLGISDRQVRALQSKGILPKSKGKNGVDPLLCIQAYIAYKSAALSKEDVPETPHEENEKSREQQLKNDEREERILLNRTKRLVLEKQYAPIDIIVSTISQVAISLRTRVDSWLPKLKMASPEITSEQLDVLKRELAMLLNELAEIKPDLSIYEDSDIESGLASFDSIEGDDTVNRGWVGR